MLLTPARRARMAWPPPWVKVANGVAATVDFDFENGRFYAQRGSNTAAVNISTVRASTGYADMPTGSIELFAANEPRITRTGLMIEEARTNVVLWCRDLTQSGSWTASNMTVALDQVGVAETPASPPTASSITATADNATILQAITLASSARWQTAFVKRLTGSGAVSMTMDNGSTWTPVTVTSSWTRVAIPTQTLANPTVGFKLATSGDAIAVDFVQNENGSCATSPILTTTVAVARAVDALSIAQPRRPTFGSAYSLVVDATPAPPTNYGTTQTVAVLNGDANNRVTIERLTATGVIRYRSLSGGTTSTGTGAAWSQNAAGKIAVAVADGDQAASFNGGSIFSTAGVLPVGVVTVLIGSTNPSNPWSGTIRRLTLWASTRLPNATLQSLTA